MILKTKHFGNVEINEEDIITFSKGIPGFEGSKKFVILHKIEDDNPFKWLQSVDDGNVAFVIINPQSFKEHYEVKIEQGVLDELETENLKDVLVYSIVTIPEEVSKMTANLRAPVLINAKKNKGMQLVLDDERYGVKHGILDEFKKTGGK
ncbi:MAG: flagellar assembly protein FliW [Ignavibacteriales bacterium]